MKLSNACTVLCGILAGCTTSESCDCVTPLPHDVTITQGAANRGPNAFSPANFTLSLASQTAVTWQNRDIGSAGYGTSGVTHSLVSDDGATFASGDISPNGIFVATLSVPGSYGYHCSIHPAMTGTLTVNP
jgi:plastocyanin